MSGWDGKEKRTQGLPHLQVKRDLGLRSFEKPEIHLEKKSMLMFYSKDRGCAAPQELEPGWGVLREQGFSPSGYLSNLFHWNISHLSSSSPEEGTSHHLRQPLANHPHWAAIREPFSDSALHAEGPEMLLATCLEVASNFFTHCSWDHPPLPPVPSGI